MERLKEAHSFNRSEEWRELCSHGASGSVGDIEVENDIEWTEVGKKERTDRRGATKMTCGPHILGSCQCIVSRHAHSLSEVMVIWTSC